MSDKPDWRDRLNTAASSQSEASDRIVRRDDIAKALVEIDRLTALLRKWSPRVVRSLTLEINQLKDLVAVLEKCRCCGQGFCARCKQEKTAVDPGV